MAGFCINCGTKLDDNVKFCPECGAPASESAVGTPETAVAVPEGPAEKPKRKRKTAEARPETQARQISENITLGTDGKYRWVYEMSLFKNPTVFILVWKIFFFIMLGGFVLAFLVSVGNRNFFTEGLPDLLKGALVPFENCYNNASSPEVKAYAAEYLKNISFRLRGEGAEYQEAYDKWDAVVKEGQ